MKHLILNALVASCHVLSAQPQLGKTHFIVGQPKATYATKAKPAAQKTETSNTTCQAYFSPQDNIKQHLLDLIEQEKKSIKISIYTFTDKEIALALIAAKQRGVDVQVITDGTAARDKFSKIGLLIQSGIRVCIYEPRSEGLMNNIMHHKFVIFGSNKDNQALLWTGSYNFTKSANLKNQENVILVQDARLIEQYMSQFEHLKNEILNPTSLKTSNKETTKQIAQKKRRTKKSLVA